MARKTKADKAKEKQAKQKKLAIGGGILLLALLGYQAPKMMKMLNQKPKPPIVAAPTGATPGSTTAAPTDSSSLAAPTLAGMPTAAAAAPSTTPTDLVSAVPVTPDPGQLEAFNELATKDPFAVQVSASGAGRRAGGSPPSSSSKGAGSSTPTPPVSTPPPTQTTPAPKAPAPAPGSATISVNGDVQSVTVGSDFPQSGATFDRVGAIFHLVSLTAKTAKISIVGGSYADGASTITLTMGKALTLQNTADGTRYVLVLEPAPTQPAPTGGASTTPTTTTPTTTTPASGGSTMSAIVPHSGRH